MRRCVSDAGLAMEEIAGVCVGLPGVVERAAGVCRQSPIFSERDVEFRRRTDAAARRRGLDRQRRQSRHARRTLVRAGARDSTISWWSASSTASGSAYLHNGELFRGANGLSPDFGDLMVRPPGSGGGRLADLASEASVLGEAERACAAASTRRAFRAGRGMALLLQLAAEGDQRCVGDPRRRPARRSASRSPI